MKHNFYQDNGYLNMNYIKNLPYTFIFVVGARGVGKTYGAIKEELKEGERFIYMRRLQAQSDMVFNEQLSPFKPVTDDLNMPEYFPERIKGVKGASGIYKHEEKESGKLQAVGDPIALLLALSTIANLRGFSGSNYKTFILDEFIPQKQERPIKDEADAFFNAYETINRNRELKGEKPLKAILLSNSNDLGNSYFIALKIVTKLQRLSEKGEMFYADKKRDFCVILLQNSPISELKKDTALYKLADNTEYSTMALNNEWQGVEINRNHSRKIIEYKAIVNVGEITIYKHKSRREYYITTYYNNEEIPTYSTGDIALKKFRQKYLYIWREYFADNIIFEEYLCEVLFRRYFDN